MRIVLLGHMGRDEALAGKLKGHQLFVIGQWENPGLVQKSRQSGGEFYVIDSVTNTQRIADIVQDVRPDMFVTNFDDALAAGVVDAVKERVVANGSGDILIPCPDKESARVEWDKFYLRQLIDEIDPSYNPVNFTTQTDEEVHEAIDSFAARGTEVVIKPRSLTGGKGVKVMGKHLAGYDEARDYACSVIADPRQAGAEVQEKLEGHEFTLQLFTDGTTLVEPPETYDYPYREDEDTGPGTGGMGAFSMQAGAHLPFVSDADYASVMTLMSQLLRVLKQKGHSYKGVLYPTFFQTPNGLKIVEVNARGGDPELVNILDLMEDGTDMGEVLRMIACGELKPDSIRYKRQASAMVYLVAPEYGYTAGSPHEFTLDTRAVAEQGCSVRFAAAEQIGANRYRTVGTSRTVGLSALGDTPWEARGKIEKAIQAGFGQPLRLEYRQQIGDEKYINSLVV